MQLNEENVDLTLQLMELRPIPIIISRKLTFAYGKFPWKTEHADWIQQILDLNPSIQSLSFHAFELCNETIALLTKVLSQNTTLTALDISASLEEAYGHFFMNLPPCITKLKLQSCEFVNEWGNENAAQLLANVLYASTSIKHFSWTSNQLDSECIATICKGLKYNSTLEVLDLGKRDEVDQLDTTPISELLMANKSIQKLYLNNCNIDQEGGTSIAQALKVNNTLKVLDLSNNNLAQSTKIFGEALKINTSLRELDLRDSSMSDMHYLFHGLVANGTLHTLNVSHKDWFDEDCRALSELLKKNSTITTLIMNGIRTESSVEMFDGLNFNQGLKTLSCTFMPSLHVESIANALHTNTTLTSLNVQYQSSAMCERKICEAMMVNNTVEKLYLTRMETVSLQYLCEMIRKNRSIAHLDYGFQFSKQEEVEQLISAVEGNNIVLMTNVVQFSPLFPELTQELENFKQRNKQIRSEVFKDMVIVLYNIIRSQESFEVLPLDVWIMIFKHWKYPGITKRLDQILNELNKDQSIRKHSE